MVIQTFAVSLSNPYASKTLLLESVLKVLKVLCKKIALMRNIIQMIYTRIRWRLEKAILFMGWVAPHGAAILRSHDQPCHKIYCHS